MSWRIDRFLYQNEKSIWEKILLFPLYLLSLPYGGAVRLRALLYSLGLLNSKHLPCPVICVGNITVGGTGKTPLVMALAKGLMKRGILVAILSRGYKGRKPSGPLVSDGRIVSLSPEESGDESLLMAEALKGIPVLVGKNRFANGRIALQRFGIRGLLLDDGYQHLQLYRDLNILLIDSHIGFGDHHLLPRGILREPLSHLRRAHLFLLTKVEHPEACQPLEARLHQIHPSAQVFHSHYEPLGLTGPEEEWEELHSLKGKKVLALSGIADPGYFSSLLRKCEMEIVREVIFPDHHLYTAKDLTSIRGKVKEVDRVVTTEKDMVKLKNLSIDHLPLRALRIEVKIWEEEEFYKRVMELFKIKSYKL
ncbi:MAG: tetraacyldisaccharide 4'-kinase [Thermodesulfobacteriota bacterium]